MDSKTTIYMKFILILTRRPFRTLNPYCIVVGSRYKNPMPHARPERNCRPKTRNIELTKTQPEERN